MPPKKRKTSDSDHEEASEGEEPVKKASPRKKAKKEKQPVKGTAGSSRDHADGGAFIELGGGRRVTVSQFKGKPLVDIREYYEKDGEQKPGKKGISLSVEQWQQLRDSAVSVDELLNKL